MPKIPMPGRRAIPSGQTYQPRMAKPSQEGAAWQRIGATLSDIGGDFANIATRMKEAEIQESFAEATADFLESEKSFMIDIEADPDYLGRLEKYQDWSNKQKEFIASRIKNAEAKKEFLKWSRIHFIGHEKIIGIGAWRLYANKTKSDAFRKQGFWIHAGDKITNDKHADELFSIGIFSEAERDEFKAIYETSRAEIFRKELIRETENRAKAILESETGGLEAALNYIEERVESEPTLNLHDQRTLSQLIRYFEKEEEIDKAQAAIKAQIVEVNNLTDILLEPDRHIHPLEIELSENLPQYKEDWEEIVSGQAEEAASETDWKHYPEIERMLFDYWNGEHDTDIAKLKTELAYERYALHSISDKEYRELISRTKEKIPGEIRTNLENIFEETRKSFRWPYTKANAKEAGRINQNLYDWAIKEISDGRRPSKKDIGKKMLELKSGKVIFRTEPVIKAETLEEPWIEGKRTVLNKDDIIWLIERFNGDEDRIREYIKEQNLTIPD